jgi:DNA repair exonuclease SbcCD ATPase subunit
MELEHLQLTNFSSFREASLSLKDRGLVLVEGENRDLGCSNGAGKSSLFNAILYALFGITAKGERADNVIRHGQDSCEVYLKLTTDQSIEVYRSRGKSDNLRLLLNGQEVGKGRDTQRLLNEAIKLDYDSFTSVAMLTQRSEGFASGTDSSRKEILNKILNLARFDIAEERAKTEKAGWQQQISMLNEGLRWLEHCVAESYARQKHLLEQQRKWTLEKQAKIDALKRRIEELQPPETTTKLELQIQLLEEELSHYNRQELADSLIQARERQKASIVSYSTLSQEAHRLEADFQEELDVEAILRSETVCPACGQRIASEQAEEARREYLRQENQLRQAHNFTVERLRKETKAKLLVAYDKGKALQEGITKASDELQHIINLEAQLKLLLPKLEQSKQQASTYESTKKTLMDDLEVAKATNWPFAQLLKEEEAKQQQTQASLNTTANSLKEVEKNFHYAHFWVHGYSKKGIQSYQLDRVLPLLTERSNAYFSQLTSGCGQITFHTTKELKSGESAEVFHADVSYTRGGHNYRNISGGERARADLAILFALGDLAASHVAIPISFRLLDEPAESLGKGGIEALANLLKNGMMSNGVSSMFVTTHQDDFKGLFEQRMLIVKEQGVSRIIE